VSSDQPAKVLLDRYYPGVPAKQALGEFETLLSNEKLKRLLGGGCNTTGALRRNASAHRAAVSSRGHGFIHDSCSMCPRVRGLFSR
jgi:hypothetical protein